MKPVVFAQLGGSAGYGGGERYISLLCEGLDPARYRPLFIAPEPGQFVDELKRRRIPTHVVHLEPLINPAALVRLVLLLRRERVTILQTHGARANLYGRLAGRLAGVPCIVSTVHNSIKDYQVSRAKQWCYEAMLRLTASWARLIICVSEALREDAARSCRAAAARAVTIRNGVGRTFLDQQGHGARIRGEWCCGDGPVLVVVARLTEQKGHRYLLEALPSLLQEWPSLTCLIVGEGDCCEGLQNLAERLGVRAACRFVGGTHAVQDFYAAADVVVLPSLSEGFPFVILEALAAGKPVVATSVNGVPEIVEDGRTGLLVPPRDAAALHRAIARMLHEPAKALAMASAGRAVVAARFTADRMVRETEAALMRALSGSTDVPPRAEGVAA